MNSLVTKIRRHAIVALFLSALFCLSATASYAQSVPGCDMADPNASVMGAMKNYSDALRVRDKAYARQIVKRNDPIAGMTCLDRAMGVTSRLGSIFSDVKSVMTVPSSIFRGTSADMMSFGVNNLLALNLNDAVTPALTNFLGNFTTGNITAAIGTYVTGFMDAIVSAVQAPLNAINASIAPIVAAVNNVETFINTINTVARLMQLPVTLDFALPPLVTMLINARDQLFAYINSVVAMINQVFMDLLNQVISMISSLVDMTCDHISSLWDDFDPLGGALSVEGNGVEIGTPYFPLRDLLTGSPLGVGAALLEELNVGGNIPILMRAADDMQLLLQNPGNLPTWRRVPAAITAVENFSDAIALMNTQ